MAEKKDDRKSQTEAAAPRDWTPAAIVSALKKARKGDRVAALKRSGILTKEGRLAKRFRIWGTKVSRTPQANEIAAK